MKFLLRSAGTILLPVCLCAVAAGLVPGCGGGGGDSANEIVIWEQKDPEEQVLLQRHIGRFMETHPGVKVSTLHFETDQLHSQFQTAALAGGGPDLVYGPADKIGPYSVMKLIRPLEDLFDAPFLNMFEKGSAASLDGHVYTVPDQVGNHLMLLYNREIVKRRPEDSDDWIEMCREITVDRDGNGIPERYGLVFNYNEPFWLAPFLGGFGGWVMDDEYNPTLNTEAMAGALRFLADMRNRHGVIPKESNYEVSDTMFKKGQAGFMINGPWSLKAYIKAGIDLGVMPLPLVTDTGKRPVPMVSSKGYSISVNVKDGKLAIVKELLTFLTSEEVQREIAGELLILPSISTLYRDASLMGSDVMRGSMEQAGYGRPMPVVPEMRAIWDAIRPFYQSVLGGQMEPVEAAREMQDRAVRKIAEMKG